MIRIVADTNDLISGILFTGVPRRILELAIEGSVRLYISPALIEEFHGVLVRPKFGLNSIQVAGIVAQLVQTAILVHPSRRVAVVNDDPDDNIVLECAIECRADAVVSGDRHLRDLGEFEGIPIQSPRVFLATRNLN